jgi:hypothetical protein
VDGIAYFDKILEKYKMDKGTDSLGQGDNIIGRLINTLFPSVKKCRQMATHTGVSRKHVLYKGLCLKESRGNHHAVDTRNLQEYIGTCSGVIVIRNTEDVVVLGVMTDFKVNGLSVTKEIKVDKNQKTWSLSVADRDINLHNLGINNKFDEMNTQELTDILYIVKALKLCTGLLYTSKDPVPDYVQREEVKCMDTSITQTKIRTKSCSYIITWLCQNETCQKCSKNLTQSFLKKSEDEDQVNESDVQDLSLILNKMFPNAPPHMKTFLQDQFNALNCADSRQHRWSPETIKMCLNLWTKSPKAFNDMKASGFMIMPSGRLLQKYKNAASQNAGINNDVFRWMHQAAQDCNLPTAGWYGGLVHDEMKIQQDLMLSTKGARNTLVGWVDTTDEGRDIHMIKTKSVNQELATEVFQVSFLGYTGFRFPIAHYPTTGISAAEIYIIIYDIISKLQSWGFYVDFILQDGGNQNRQFIKLHFRSEADASCQNFCSTNVVNPTEKIAHSQDFSHNIKKIRNAILSSGNDKHSKRNIIKGEHAIQWRQWVDAAKWDSETNSRKIHHKLTASHLHPDSAEKMRNHLAEEVLDSNMLNLMVQYKNSLKNGAVLDSAIELLTQTSELISIFRDKRPIKSMDDTRLSSLKAIRQWFREWRNEISNEEQSAKLREKMLPSKTCLDDIDCLLATFSFVTTTHLKRFPGMGLYPFRYNSDIIENNFCQVRGLHNGMKTNPTYLEYQSTMNSVILGESVVSKSRKSNANPNTNPYKVDPIRKRKTLADISNTVFQSPSKQNCIKW